MNKTPSKLSIARAALSVLFLTLSLLPQRLAGGAQPIVQGPKLLGLYGQYRSRPLDGQNFWHLAPQDLYPGTINFSCKRVTDVDRTSFVFVPNSTWGVYSYKVTRLRATPNEISEPRYRGSTLRNNQIRFSEIDRAVNGASLLLEGTITELKAGGSEMNVVLPFVGEDVLCRFDLVASEPSETFKLITHRNIPYGDHWRNVIDFYQVRSDQPTPVIVQIHGGGWGALDKSNTMGIEKVALANGISFASINYRFISDAGDVKPPVKVPLLDAARAVQTLRYLAEELNIDKERIACCGGSAGGCSSLWLAFHDDLADPDSSDPVARQSTRLWCAGGVDPQTSLDPEQMRRWIPTITYGAHAYGVKAPPGSSKDSDFEMMLSQRETLLPWINEYSPYAIATADDPPVYLHNPMRDIEPEPGEKGHPTHSPMFGIKLKERLDQLGVESYVCYKGHPCEKYPSLNDFLVAKLKSQKEGPSAPSHGKKKEKVIRLLWLGSSSTYYHDAPRDVARLITEADNGYTAESDLIGRSGTAVYKYLEPDFRFEYGLKPGQSVLDKIRTGRYEVVILQVPTDYLAGRGDNDKDLFVAGLRTYTKVIRESGSKPVFYEQGWAEDELFTAGDGLLLELARELDVPVAACRSAWRQVREDRPELELHNLPDRTHPGAIGKYLNNCCFYEVITGMSPVGLSYREIACWPLLDDEQKRLASERLKGMRIDDDYVAALPSWMQRNSISASTVTLDDELAEYLQKTALESQKQYRQQIDTAGRTPRMEIGTNFWDVGWGGERNDPFVNGYQNVTGENPWKSEFLDEIKIYAVFRFMDWGKTNNAVQAHTRGVRWEDRVTKSDRLQRPMAYEWMIDLCNRTQRDMWVCVPHFADEHYIYQLACLIRDHLEPTLKCYVEWSNETWNGMFKQAHYCNEQAKKLELPPGTKWENNLWYRGQMYHAHRTFETFYQFERAFKDQRDRLVTVIGGTAAHAFAETHISAIGNDVLNPHGVKPQAYALAPYFGNGLDGSDPDIVQKAREAIGERLIGISRVERVVREAGLDFITYEGGQHLKQNSDIFCANPAIYDIYLEYLNDLEKHFSLLTHYTHNGSHSSNNSWGAKRFIGEPVELAHKYRAIRDYVGSAGQYDVQSQ